MPIMTTTREPTPDERAAIARRMEHKRPGTSTALGSHRKSACTVSVNLRAH